MWNILTSVLVVNLYLKCHLCFQVHIVDLRWKLAGGCVYLKIDYVHLHRGPQRILQLLPAPR